MMSSINDADFPDRSGGYKTWRNLQKKSKEKHRLLFTRMGRAAGPERAGQAAEDGEEGVREGRAAGEAEEGVGGGRVRTAGR